MLDTIRTIRANYPAAIALRTLAEMDSYESAVEKFASGGSRSELMAARFGLGIPADQIHIVASYPGQWLPAISLSKRNAALLFPIGWPEPFGLVMIEAMACGTPVIAYRAGSVPEVVEDGVTGFIVDNEEQAIRAVNELGRLDRRVVRARFEERFAASRMAKEYERRYRALLGRGGREGFEKGAAISLPAVGTASEPLR